MAAETRDNKGRIRYGPKDRVPIGDRLWPRRHGKWWLWDYSSAKSKDVDQLVNELRTSDLDLASNRYDMVVAVAKTASDRGDASERRATTVASASAIAASFTLSGCGLLLDGSKWTGAWPGAQVCFGIGIAVTVVLFVLAAVFALRTLASAQTRRWNWFSPNDLSVAISQGTVHDQMAMRSARVLNDFASNWEIADLKTRMVRQSFRCLVMALGMLVVVVAIAVSVVVG